jgi:hypothetical protein
MSILLEKSDQNSICADFLMTKKYYNAAVSRAYYSSLQYVMYILRSKLNIPASELSPENNSNTHIKAQTLISPHIEAKDEDAYKFFQQAFLGLKTERVKADYKEYNFDETTSNKAVSTALRIRKTLERVFNK